MRTQRVVTNLRCNQNCTYCPARQVADDLATIQPQAVRSRIDAALASGATELIFTGGEPTLRRDLEDLVSPARRAAAHAPPTIPLATNGPPVDAAPAPSLRAAAFVPALLNPARTGPDPAPL